MNNEEAENNKEGSDKDILSISANNTEESELDKNNREFEQTALKYIVNSSAQGNKDRQDINSENNEEKIIAISGCLKRVTNPFWEK